LHQKLESVVPNTPVLLNVALLEFYKIIQIIMDPSH